VVFADSPSRDGSLISHPMEALEGSDRWVAPSAEQQLVHGSAGRIVECDAAQRRIKRLSGELGQL
jgi:hypothetical protein